MTYSQLLVEIKRLPTAEQLRLLEEVAAIVRRASETKPKRSIMELEGLGAELWQKISVDKYLEQERNSWNG